MNPLTPGGRVITLLLLGEVLTDLLHSPFTNHTILLRRRLA